MEYNLKLNQQDIQTLSVALGEMPLKMSVNVFSKIQQQVADQDEASAVSLEDMGFSQTHPEI